MKNVFTFILLASTMAMFSSCGPYNKIEANDESVTEAWANVESQYQRRLDLIDNLVATVKGAADFEKETFIGVAEARSGVVKPTAEMLNDPQKLAAFYESQNKVIEQAGLAINVAVERYPELKATDAFRDLQAQLEGTENRINKARDDYNAAVRSHNTYIRQIPGRWYNGLFNGLEKYEPFAADPGAEKAPKVEF